MFCQQCGSEADPGANFCGRCGGRLAGSAPASPEDVSGSGAGVKEQLLKALERELSSYPQLSAARGDRTDLEIKSVLADASWGVGKKKVEYSACLLAREDERTVVYWEMIKEVQSGVGIFGFFKVEKYKSDGRTISGRVSETGYGPGGKIIDYDWDYARTRGLVEGVAKACGWKFKTVLMKGKAMY